MKIYETKISDKRWIAYDLPGNIGWIAYITGLILSFINAASRLSNGIILTVLFVSVLPAVMMVIGIAELINERIHKLDRILSKSRLYRGFGMLFYGSIAGAVTSAVTLICACCLTKDDIIIYIWLMLCGAILCAVFSGLLFKGYKPKNIQ